MSECLPAISVVLPVYNGERYLEEAIASILKQTFENIELIIIDDGSTDKSPSIVTSFVDSRIRFFRQENRGLAATLNRGIGLAKAGLIARQDQDDVSYPTRFEKQYNFLLENPGVAVLGTWADIWEDGKNTARTLTHPSGAAALKFNLCFDNYLVHSSIMMRKDVVDNLGGYTTDRNRQPPEDYELWSRIMQRYDLDNLPEKLIAYREVATSMSRQGVSPFKKNIEKISIENIARICNDLVDIKIISALVNLRGSSDSRMPRGVSYLDLRRLLLLISQNVCIEKRVKSVTLKASLRQRQREVFLKWLDCKVDGRLRALKSLRRWA
jgi:glycosyltransferase involved in cell wall biosynthesis